MYSLRTTLLLTLCTGAFAASINPRDTAAVPDASTPDAVTPDSATPDASSLTVTYDYIVVGGGTAGLALASKLAQRTSNKVAVIEAGDYYPNEPKINIPGMFGSIAGDPQFDWMHMSTPQPGLGGASQLLPRAKALGGTSAMNTMVWNRASSTEYNAWETLGSSGWNWNNILRWSKITETATPAPPSTPPGYLYTYNSSSHGTSGPVKLSFPKWSSDIIPVVFNTMKAWGIPLNTDGSDGTNIGGVSAMNSVDLGSSTRSYSASAYFANCNQLISIKNAQVTKINLSATPNSSGNYAATGVTYTSGGKTITVKVNKEVIVSGGTYNTPQILELSGIGNKDILTKAGVKPIINLPGVGENLQDHMQLVLKPIELVPGFTTRDILNDPTVAAQQLNAYNTNKTGPYSSSLVSVGYFPLSTFTDPATKATLLQGLDQELAAAQSKLNPADAATYAVQRQWLNGTSVASLEFLIFPLFLSVDPTVTPKANTSYLTFGLCPQHTFSRGSVHIGGSDPLAHPVIDPEFFSFNYDKKMMVEAVKSAVSFISKDPIKSAIANNPFDASWNDDTFIESYITKYISSEYHPVGTAAMLPRAKNGVVDNNLKVYGTTNIRVVDASIFPIHVSAHVQSTIYAIAEAAFEKISGLSS